MEDSSFCSIRGTEGLGNTTPTFLAYLAEYATVIHEAGNRGRDKIIQEKRRKKGSVNKVPSVNRAESKEDYPRVRFFYWRFALFESS